MVSVELFTPEAPVKRQLELLAPAKNADYGIEAIRHGADAVYIGMKDDTNARHFAGLNFNDGKLEKAADYVKWI